MTRNSAATTPLLKLTRKPTLVPITMEIAPPYPELTYYDALSGAEKAPKDMTGLDIEYSVHIYYLMFGVFPAMYPAGHFTRGPEVASFGAPSIPPRPSTIYAINSRKPVKLRDVQKELAIRESQYKEAKAVADELFAKEDEWLHNNEQVRRELALRRAEDGGGGEERGQQAAAVTAPEDQSSQADPEDIEIDDTGSLSSGASADAVVSSRPTSLNDTNIL